MAVYVVAGKYQQCITLPYRTSKVARHMASRSGSGLMPAAASRSISIPWSTVRACMARANVRGMGSTHRLATHRSWSQPAGFQDLRSGPLNDKVRPRGKTVVRQITCGHNHSPRNAQREYFAHFVASSALLHAEREYVAHSVQCEQSSWELYS